MVPLLFVLAVLAATWVLAYIGPRLIVTTVVLGVIYLAGLFAGIGWVLGVLGGVALAGLVVLNVVGLRRTLVTGPAFRWFKSVQPEMSSTEREAIEAGDVWWEAELFRGRPQWNKLKDFQYTRLTPEETRFLAVETEEVCRLVDDWKVEFEDHDLPEAAWQYLKDKKFFAMLIGKEHGGLGFSYLAQSAVVTKLATHSLALAVTVMVPNSLGPGELLSKYGTREQQEKWLPRLVAGQDIPCFGLTGPEVGSDATAMPDYGLVGYGEYQGNRTLGLHLTFHKRWITLAPVATLVGLAFKLKDPDGLLGDKGRVDYGITCALVPSDTPGLEIGRRNYPGSSFMNGTIHGDNVFVPLDAIIGGPAMAGKGWRMLIECLGTGRGISLPALSVASAQTAYRTVGAHVRVRRQFGTSIGQFEGVQEALGRIAGHTYTLEAMRQVTASAVDTCTPSVVTALAKYHMTEIMRKVINDGMDVLGGRGVQHGPRNYLTNAYGSIPVAITVEGANILTRTLMIFGQGAIRCHEFVFPEMEAARNDDAQAFDGLLIRHVGSVVNRAARAFTHALTGSALAGAEVGGDLAHHTRSIERLSAALYFAANVTMLTLGGELKRRERLSARLGDVLSQLYIASCALKHYDHNGRQQDERDLADWAITHALAEAGRAFGGFIANTGFMGGLIRVVCFPLGINFADVSDKLSGAVAKQMQEASETRERLTHLVYTSGGPTDPVGRMEHAWAALEGAEVPYTRFVKALGKDKLDGTAFDQQLQSAIEKGILTPAEARTVAEYDAIRRDAMATDDFTKEYLASGGRARARAEVINLAAGRARA